MSTKFEKTERIIWSQEECGTGVWPFMWNGDKWLKVKEVRKIAVEAVEVTYIHARLVYKQHCKLKTSRLFWNSDSRCLTLLNRCLF